DYSTEPPSNIIDTIQFHVNAYADQIQTNNTDKPEIVNLQVNPSTIKVGDKFTINATLVNNSPNTIYVETNDCTGPFSVAFDNHVIINHKYEGCTLTATIQELFPAEKITATSARSNDVYMARSAGTVNVTIAFAYFVKSKSDTYPQRLEMTISKSFLFVIYDNNTGIKTIK